MSYHNQYNAPSGFQPNGGFNSAPSGPGYGAPTYDQNQYGNSGYNPNPSYGAPQYGQQQGYGQQQYGQQQYGQQGGQQGGQAAGYYGDQAPGASGGFSGTREASDMSNEDLPYPWVREWDEQFKQIYYVNPTTNPATTSWTHPNCAPGQEHPEQQQTHREAQELYSDAGPGGAQTGERGLITNAAVGVVGYKVLSSLLNKNKNNHGQGGHGQSSGPGWGTYAMGAGAGVGGAFLLSKLFGNKNSNKYGHQMGPPPFKF
ncbi:hypothetical protein CcaverHIS002_0100220 [Cutaneotrichosporon cavernicola]|uniref:WW domain-containing protein n=1 Tax=Cutaneotrichosporon cavernicola TaxID=279322 RepID=A0AA48I6W6_9TREE|nr:uncharacterized protein CcaverHIS019_0100200 [Cutaneotrichosporon cavernicola]BEI79493.1 hypothetical protein CcaverHIS002_0100220 [Cutaneotrichosporon cavernicola]BEI87302.1 hypothetical protein CcaverHIS019_0100200 [Cutaneotrichosporon cavernicola]BEI95072.1 hypothetical protein CcaverHIS631_0100210 [Cutaneotrichosporon cavernicola]BEJ02846.1 hypothetical protein CcaverHIS641_0100210 [Cutaneotrichosporon cavernicola]